MHLTGRSLSPLFKLSRIPYVLFPCSNASHNRSNRGPALRDTCFVMLPSELRCKNESSGDWVFPARSMLGCLWTQ